MPAQAGLSAWLFGRAGALDVIAPRHPALLRRHRVNRSRMTRRQCCAAINMRRNGPMVSMWKSCTGRAER
jgi:hypothetical protein